MNEAFKELDSVFDSIIDEIENPGRSYGNADIFRNLHGEKTEYADYAKVVYTIIIRVADDNMSAAINVISTADKLRRYTVQELNRVIRSKRIVCGIDSEALMRMVSKQIFNKDVVFARGINPENGTDGAIEHLVEFPEGKSYIDVKSGTPLCRVIAPTAGIAGADIFGHSIPAVNGASISVPIGENTVFDKKTGILSASAGGRLTLKNGVYAVCDEYVINGGITKENGKIEFEGSIVINGNVTDGAYIIAKKSITVKGKVSGNSTIIAKDRLTVELSVKNSTLTTENGDMKLMSCFDSFITCGKDLEAASLYNCKTKCIGNLDCTINQGSINGGETFCVGKLSCITAGSRLHEKTEITVGDSSDFMAEKIMVMRSINRIDGEIEKISRRISTIEGQHKNLGFISREDEDFLNAAIRIRNQKEAEKIPLLEKIEKIEEIIASANDSVLKVQRSMHANVYLKIKEHKRKIDAEFGKITVYSNDYGIVIS